MRLFFVRHGESEANLLNLFSDRGFQHPLTTRGRNQVKELGEKLKGITVAKIFSSPLMRACQTAEILSSMLAAPYSVADALREYDCGILEGKSDAESWQLYETVLHEWMVHKRWERRIDGGESYLDMQIRFLPFINWIAESYNHSPHALVVVGHGGIYRCMLPLILINIDFNFALEHPMGNAGYVLAEPHANGLRCIKWCEEEVIPPTR